MSARRAARGTLDRERVITSALELADRDGLDSLTIRALAERLGVRPMAVYHYVASKDELLDALVDVVFREVYSPGAGDLRDELSRRCTSMRAALVRHPWVLPIMDTRSRPGGATLASHEAVLDLLRRSGFSVAATAHAYAVLDAFVYGFALTEAMLATAGLRDDPGGVADGMDLRLHPRVAELAALYVTAPEYPYAASFGVGLDIVLDGVERLADAFPEG